MVTDSVVPASLAARIERLVPGAQAAPMTASLEMLTLHGRKTATLVIGFEPGRLGGPWQMHDGRRPAGLGEIAVDRVLARQHGIALGDRFAVRGQPLRVVGITDKTSAWMTPLLFTTRSEANALSDRGDVASYIVVRAPDSPSALRDAPTDEAAGASSRPDAQSRSSRERTAERMTRRVQCAAAGDGAQWGSASVRS